MITTMTETAYTPGICNINTQEIAQRRKAGYFGLAGFSLLLVVLLTTDVTRIARLLLFVPAYVAAIGFLQARARFCVGYAAAGMQRADESADHAQKVDDAAMAQDKHRARRMNTQAFIIALAATVTALLVPSL